MQASLGSNLLRINTLFVADDITMKGVFDERAAALRARSPDARRVSFVVGEQRLPVCVSIELSFTQPVFVRQVWHCLGQGIVGFQAFEVLA